MKNTKKLTPGQVLRANALRKAVLRPDFWHELTHVNEHDGLKTEHALEKHVNADDVYMAKRLLMKEAKTISTFDSKDNLKDYVCDAIGMNATKIIQWIDDKSEEYTKHFNAHIFEEDEGLHVGRGFAKNYDDIKEYWSNNITIVLRKNKMAGYGFTLVTAYPQMTGPGCILQPTGRDISKELMLAENEIFKERQAQKNQHAKSLADIDLTKAPSIQPKQSAKNPPTQSKSAPNTKPMSKPVPTETRRLPDTSNIHWQDKEGREGPQF